jgi:uncharacterized integral membrane protein (TIGR00698 family)
MKSQSLLFFFIALVCCVPSFVSSSIALLLGITFAISFGNNYSFKAQTSTWGGYLLKSSVIGLGFGINFKVLLEAGKNNMATTAFFVFGAMIIGLALGRLLKIDKKIALLVSAGTAICGGSAIAAVGSVVKADANQLSISTGVVFLLNALALFSFPAIGHWLGLSQMQFGTWAAIAIHDMSSVVGAATKYGDEALQIASITKMLRVLWIIPLSLALVLGFKENRESFKIPSFIIGFLLASCLFSFLPQFQAYYAVLYRISKQIMVVSLFLIGSSISFESIKKVGISVILQASTVWIIICLLSLYYVMFFQK